MGVYLYKFSDGHTADMTCKQAGEYEKDNNVEMVYNGFLEKIKTIRFSGTNTKKRGYDGFRAGYNPGLGCVVKSRYHQNELMKEKGLIEVGNERLPQEKPDTSFKFSRNEIKEIKEDIGIKLSDNEADAMREGNL